MRLIQLIFAVVASICISILPVAYAKTLRMAVSDDALTLDPHAGGTVTTTRLLNNIYEGLVRRDKDFNIAPSLAVSWSQPDAKTRRFKLRSGVIFHDGSAFTTDDVVFSVGRALHPLSSSKWTLQGVAMAKKIDDLAVDLTMMPTITHLPCCARVAGFLPVRLH